MEIVCPECGKAYQVPEEQLSGPVVKARCKACGSVFRIPKSSGQVQGRQQEGIPSASQEREPGPGNAFDRPESGSLKRSDDEEDPGLPGDVDNPASGDHSGDPSPPTERGRRDYAAIAVLLAAVAALVIVSVLGIKNIDKDSIFRPLRSISRLTGFFEGKGARLTDKARLKKGRQNIRFLRHLSQGHRYFRDKKYDAALREYNLAIRSDPGKYTAYYWRGQLFVLKKEYEKAIQDMNTVLRLNPSHQKVHRTLGWAYYEAGKYDEAIGALDRYIDFNPNDGWAFYERGLCYYRKGDLATALKNAKKACDLGFKRGCDVYNRYR